MSRTGGPFLPGCRYHTFRNHRNEVANMGGLVYRTVLRRGDRHGAATDAGAVGNDIAEFHRDRARNAGPPP